MESMFGAEPIVVDASPVIGLSKIGRFSLLQQVFGKIAVTREVRDELLRGEGRPGGVELTTAIEDGWVEVVDADANPDFSKLGAGEATTLAYANRVGALAVLDDDAGRMHAQAHGLRVLGTVGVLILAKRKGIVEAIGPLLDELRKHKFYLSKPVIDIALADSGERSK